ncbi:hypothetical protein [Parahaliea mediterranea]|uniref:FlgO domain-containing protein n=1 Tax=Parahaliea mediterranea TaxID=651086 RepID=A0A939DDC7_9GAMM|nr:hypothetical protein [Parahaliea mediterranea]MBN7795502.1 hypothetical protein [Parahaliea mediterranea]
MPCRLLIVTLATVLLSGCFAVMTSQAPIATSYGISDQQKMQAAHHWLVLAEHEAHNMLRSPALSGKALFVEPGEDVDFARGFESLLTSELVTRGGFVRTEPVNTALVDTRVQVVRHKDRDFVRAPQGALTALATGIAVATIPYNHWTEPALALIPAAVAGDAYSGSWLSRSNTEVIVTTRVTENSRILYSSSNIYYINSGDNDHYGAARSIPVTDQW